MSKINITEEQIKNASQPKSNHITDTEEYKKLLQELDDIAKKYEFPLEKREPVDTEINLERKTFTDVSDEDLKKQVKDSLASYKITSENKIKEDALKKQQTVLEEIETAKDTAKSNKETTSAYYDQAKQNAENDALKRGLSRSSIIVNTLSAFDQDRINKLTQIDKNLTEQIEGLNDQINLLTLEKDKALEDFNIEYASKLNTKLAELKSDLQARKDEVTEYNNKIAQIEKEYKKEAMESNSNMKAQSYAELLDRVEFFLNNGDKISEATTKENFTAIKDFLESIDANEAVELLENSKYLREMLGYNYSSLLNYFKHQ